MTIKLLLIDDEDWINLSKSIRELGDGAFEVDARPPPEDLSLTEVSAASADLYLVDYELDTRQPGQAFVSYRGMTLAARLRELMSEYPIVLLTRSNLPSWTAVQRTAQAGGTFDEILYKDTDLQCDGHATKRRLVALASGYRTLRDDTERSVPGLLKLLRTDEVGREYAREALPPGDGWKGFEAAHWIRTVLLRYPGVLYSVAHAATALGISVQSFCEEPVQELVTDAMYRGPFSEAQPRWWRHTLFDIAYGVCANLEMDVDMREGFRLVGSERLEIELQPSQDVETAIAPADTVCHLLGVPVRIETSLPYQPDVRPKVMEEARVSFKAIRERNDVDEMYVDAGSRERIDEIRAEG